MPCISGQFDPYVGILLEVTVHGAAAQSKKVVETKGLVDTGASGTSVSPEIVRELGLMPQGKVMICGATGAKAVHTYMVEFGLGFGGMRANIPDLCVSELDLGQAGPQVLIGRDIILRGVFTTDFTNHFTFSI